MRVALPNLGALVGVGDDQLKLRPLADELRSALWSHVRDDPIDLGFSELGRACKWLDARLMDDPRVDLDVLALGAFALQSWDREWIATEDGRVICDRLKNALGPCDSLSIDHVWAGAVALRVLLKHGEHAAYASALANSLAARADTPDRIGIPAGAQVAVSLQSAGIAEAGAVSTNALVARLELADPYSVAQVVWSAGERGEADSEQVEQWRDFIADWLNRVELHRANLVAACACIQALATSAEVGIVTEVRVLTERVLEEGRRQDGSWYDSPWNTAWALLAAYAARRVRAISLSAGEAAELIERVNEKLAGAEYDAINRVQLIRTAIVPAIFASGMVFVGVCFAAALVLYYDGFTTLLSLLGAGLTAACVVSLAAMWRFYKRLRVF